MGPERTARASLVGLEERVRTGPIAHGGHVVARRADGQVAFVRHALPGEDVTVRITRGQAGDRFVLADAVAVHEPAAGRVGSACGVAGPGGCGGCDFQHVDLEVQRELKAAVVAEQLARLAGLDVPVVVDAVPGDTAGLGWRTRVEFAVDPQGRPGLHPHHDRAVLPLSDCPIAHPDVLATGALGRRWRGQRAVDVVAPSGGPAVTVAVPSGLRRTPQVVEIVEGRRWRGRFTLNARGFWQGHPGAAAVLVDRVLDALEPRPGERALDLYAGVGLFARALADAVGPTGAVLAIEQDARACAALGRAAAPGGEHGAPAGLEQLEVRRGRVDRELAPLRAGGDVVDLVVLDPPRAGAGRDVIATICALGPRAVAYVACDPAAFARDVAVAAAHGYALTSLTAHDAFPMTHHVECVGVLTPRRSAP